MLFLFIFTSPCSQFLLYLLLFQEITIFSENGFTGTLPASLLQLKNLLYFAVNSNSLTGSVPEGLFDLTKLTVLWMNENSFTGTISEQIGNLVNLESLDLSENFLSKKIPDSIGTLPLLLDMRLQKNVLSGTLPQLFNYELELLFIQGNQLSGSMKDVIWNPAHSKLVHIDLSSNLFSGEVGVRCI